ncbi:hypothetical protein [Gayadomonas joobiniege]|uniref:hypothetical protein n=1 Tax=Gayadomonas joobiniege TaxID=1234606 RepID=UPI000372E930|nr:hypothetical protein [Gayadomonas joobiniege]
MVQFAAIKAQGILPCISPIIRAQENNFYMNDKKTTDQAALENAVAAIKIALQAQQLPKNQTLTALGLAVEDVIKYNYAKDVQGKIAENFSQALKQSIKGS